MLSSCEVTDIFYLCDEFTTDFEDFYPKRALREDNSKKHRNKPNRLSDSEVMTILIAFPKYLSPLKVNRLLIISLLSIISFLLFTVMESNTVFY